MKPRIKIKKVVIRGESLPYIDFYSSHGIIPTRQDITNFQKHLQRRKSLYYHLGIPDGVWKNSSVLEIGPGSGHNAIVTASMRPKRYLLVDANGPSIDSTRSLLQKHTPSANFELIQKPVLEFKTRERFDVVLAEGLIPMQKDPKSFLKHISEFTANEGILVFTTNDSISVFSEMLRRWQGWNLCRGVNDFEKKVEILANFFLKDIESLPGMSRLPKDWVTDQLIHPWAGPLFSIPEAVSVLEKSWVFLGVSPRFIQDWRWYKTIHGSAYLNKQFLRDQYYKNAHQLLDCRNCALPLVPSINRRVETITQEVFNRVFKQERGQQAFPAALLARKTREISKLVQGVLPETSKSLNAFCDSIDSAKSFKQHVKGFASLWGRGQQYMSFVRQADAVSSAL